MGALRLKLPQSVGQLNFTPAVLGNLFEDIENLGRKDVPSDDGQVGRRCPLLRFLNHLLNPVNPIPYLFPLDDSVEVGL